MSAILPDLSDFFPNLDSRRDGELVVLIKCGKCGKSTLGRLLGSPEKLRRVVGRDTWEKKRRGKFLARGAGPFGKGWEEMKGELSRYRFFCHSRCDADIPVRRDKLERTFLRAIAEGRSKVYIPQDL